ncbi:ParA family protein [Ancylomarina sp. 16SWW S1-10-2]|nr:ParA family protein [Ancylomarina sp. 16SWW S1-10-2]
MGKTTTACSLASALSLKSKRILLIDLDPQCNLSQSLGVGACENNIYQCLKEESEFSPMQIMVNLDIVPSTIDLNAFELEMSGEPGREYLLRELLYQVKNDYDYIIIDCSPSLGLVALNALTASDSYLVPLLPHHLSIQGLSKLLEVTQKIKARINPKLELEGVLLTQFSHRKVMHKDISEVIRGHFNGKLYETCIRENIALAEAPSAGIDIFRYAPKSNGAEDYFNLCEEFLSKQH